MKRILIPIIFLLLEQSCATGQGYQLQSRKYGLDIIEGNFSKEAIIENVRFSDGRNKNIDIIRFDNVGEIHGDVRPLIISVQEPISVDSLGLLPMQLVEDSLASLMESITGYENKVSKNYHTQDTIIRITYRVKGSVDQFFVANAKSATVLFKRIEKRLLKMGDKNILTQFYHFVGSAGLIRKPRQGRDKWRY